MQHLEVSGAVRPLKWSLGVKWLKEEQSYTSTPPLGLRGLFQGERDIYPVVVVVVIIIIIIIIIIVIFVTGTQPFKSTNTQEINK